MDGMMLRAATVQFEPRPGAKEYNLARIEHFARAAADDGVQLVAFPEMCLLGYWHLTKRDAGYLHDVAEPDDGPSIARISALAAELHLGIGFGLLTERDGWLFNAYAVCLPDGTVHIHRKLHAFEHEAISCGGRYTVFDTPWDVRVGVLICYDNNLIENVRATALLGAQILLAPHQTGGTNSVSPHGMKPIPLSIWERRHADPAAVEDAFRGPNGREWLLRWLPSRAHDNGLFLIFSNGVGRDDDEVRTGNAMIIDPYGRIIAESWATADAMAIADLDLDLVPASTGRRWLRARRPELYRPLTAKYGDEVDARTARFS
jgi:predicted amidohydrolase